MSQASDYLGRVLQLTIEPVQGGTSALRYTTNGTPQEIRFSAQIHKSIMGEPNPSSINIWNLSPKTRNDLRTGGARNVTLEAGYANKPLATVFEGSMLNCMTTRSGPNVITSLKLLQGFNALSTRWYNPTFAGGTSVRQAVIALGRQLPNVTVNDANLVGVKGYFGPRGWAFAGSIRDALTQLANEYGFSWQIDNGVLYCIDDFSSLPNMVLLEGSPRLINNYNEDVRFGPLMQVTPLFMSPAQTQIGVKIRALFVPGILAGCKVKVMSGVDETLDGIYRVHTAAYNLDAYTSTFTMELDSFRVDI